MGKYKILCIDDEEKILSSLKRLFLNEPYSVIITTKGEKALEYLKQHPVDILITDQRMPGMQGIEVLKQAKVLSPQTTRIMITGYADIGVTIEAINEGEIHRYITKPWDNREFLAVVRNALEAKNHVIGNEKKIEHERQLQEMQSLAKALHRANFSTVQALSNAIELKDKYTKGHCGRVLQYSILIANKLGYPAKKLLALKYAALLHDVGKIGVPSAILNKNGPLDDEEWISIKAHPANGAAITKEVEFLKGTARVILEHHERIDGKGYPDGKSGDEILEQSKIVAIADVYDALTSTRSYRKAFSMEKACSILVEGKGTQFDARLVDIFLVEIELLRAVSNTVSTGEP